MHDAYRFTKLFSECIEQGPQMVYNSALTFAPISSTIYKLFHDKIESPWVVEGFMNLWPPLLIHISAHQHVINSVVISEDGQRIVSGSEDKSIRVWDTDTGVQLSNNLLSHEEPVLSLALSADGRRIFSGSYDKTVRTWDFMTLTEIVGLRRCFDSPVLVISCSKSFNNPLVACGLENGLICVWAVGSTANAISPLLCTFQAHSDPICSIALSPNDASSRIVSGSVDGSICLWDTSTGRAATETPHFDHEDAVRSLSFSSDGAWVASASMDSTIYLWDLKTGIDILDPVDGKNRLTCASLSHDNSRIAAGGEDKIMRVWDVSTGKEVKTFQRKHASCITSLCYSSDGSKIVSADDAGDIQVWDELVPLRQSREKKVDMGYRPWALAFSPDGKRIASSAMADFPVQVWDALTKSDNLVNLEGHTDVVRDISFSSSGDSIATGAEDCTVQLWNATSGQRLYDALQHKAPVLSVRFSPNDVGVVASGSLDNLICLWRANTGECFFKQDAGKPVMSINFSPKADYIVAGLADGTIQFSLTCPGAHLSALKSTRSLILSVAFSDDGEKIFSAARDGYLRIWDTSTECILEDDNSIVMSAKQDVGDPIRLRSDGCIHHCRTGRLLSYLPQIMDKTSMTSIVAIASSETAIAIGVKEGELFIVHFPPKILNESV